MPVYVALSVVLVQRLGGAVAFALVILGQMTFALFMDNFGWFGITVHEITPTRIIGARSGRGRGCHDPSVLTSDPLLLLNDLKAGA